ncbi:hypothetical protein K1Y38_25590 [Serratia marcescens]|uniref:DUF7006 family protein n=1 Tax=Enterococcus mundtii TaxID=53346 RepID=UPI002238FCFC|nr:hypothetical protein [Serratia marcescens]
MLAETIKSPEEFLFYSKYMLQQSGVLKSYPKINDYYNDLCAQFIYVFHDEELLPFEKWGKLLQVDAQIQMLLELLEFTKEDIPKTFGMSEDQIIRMIHHDKKTFYRELTGENIAQNPRWGLIYLSEE